MKKSPLTLPTLILLLLCVLMLASSQPPAAAAGEAPNYPPIPDLVYGLALVNNFPVPAGTIVSAWCGGVKYTQSATIDDPQYMYSLGIPGDDPDTTPTKEGCTAGETITFKIGDNLADQQKAWVSGGSTQLDLSLTNQIPIYLPLVWK